MALIPPRAEDGRSCADVVQEHVLLQGRSRFQYYARRVRFLKVPCSYQYSSTDSRGHTIDIVSRLASLCSSVEVLFPSLISLEWEQSSPHGNELFAFLSPTLSHLNFWVGSRYRGELEPLAGTQDNSTLEQLTGALSSVAPFLRTLRLSGSSPRRPLAFGPAFSQLRALVLNGTTTSTTLSSCAALESLSELTIGLLDTDLDALTPCVGFPALETLAVTGSFSSISHLLCTISSTSLRSFVMPDLYPTPESWRDCSGCFAALAAQFAPSLRLIKINCYLEGDGIGENDSTALGLMDVLNPLLALHLLEDFTIELRGVPLSSSDQDVREMAVAWPRLVNFALGYTPGSASPSVYSLSEFARHCPDLVVLHLLRMEIPAHPPVEPETQQSSKHGLQSMLFAGRHDPIWEPQASQLAKFLDHTFPGLQPDCLHASGWAHVVAALGRLRSSRMEVAATSVADDAP
ncbi:hypothetical protein SCP_0507200 [Sparassis crispa]|uniref:F-box domain-containing protein n=1 Tax=Sparassis crispa TaxID=139825 RepID=A0A401GN72_9APHY|nr:hypothetical protein SCP_0507200 [Sparassis crispa]GBE83665.1 hypothetical protein SCP_0507200 [Sparassis crispa]